MRLRMWGVICVLAIFMSSSVASAQVTFKKSKYRDLSSEWDVIAVIQTFAKCGAFRDVFYSEGSGGSYLDAAVNLSIHEEVRNSFETGLWVNALYEGYKSDFREFKDTATDQQIKYKIITEKKPCAVVEDLRVHYD